MSALPFLSAAKMTDEPWWKVVFYAGSALGPLSRVNDNAHYPSQVMLGWWLAYLSASAVAMSDEGDASWRVIPYASPQETGFAVEYDW